jgi:serine/threonine protein kinase
MTMPAPDPLTKHASGTDEISSAIEAGRVFQCVCGRALNVPEHPATTLQCPQCGRQIASGMLDQSMASLEATVIGSMTTESDSALSLSSGERLDHFTVLDSLGAGGMGAVFRARDESLQRFVAIKVLKSRAGEGGRTRRERLIQEARAQARVSHPHVVHIYYVGTHEECPFFAMEYVPGMSLARLIQQQRLPFRDIVRIGLETADALRHSASLGIVHGDVKPGNLLLDEKRSVKLSDFGLACCSDSRANGQSQTGPAGTVSYMAPEVAAGQAADVQSDMYSLGIMLYELTFGELPESASSDGPEETLRLRQSITVKFPLEWPSDRPETWKDFLSQLVHRDSRKRFPSYDQLISKLSTWQPITVRRAGRIIRLISWTGDMGAAGIVAGTALASAVGIASLMSYSMESILMPMLLTGGILLSWICWKLRNTPGKSLLQLQIVDEFGLRPALWKFAASVLGTFLPFVNILIDASAQALLAAAGSATNFDSDTIVGRLLDVLLALWIAANALWLMFSRRQQTLTDWLLGVYVVLDTGVGIPEQSAASGR